MLALALIGLATAGEGTLELTVFVDGMDIPAPTIPVWQNEQLLGRTDHLGFLSVTLPDGEQALFVDDEPVTVPIVDGQTTELLLTWSARPELRIEAPSESAVVETEAVVVHGTLLGPDGQPVAGARLYTPGAEALSDADGRFTIEVVSPTLSVIAQGFATATVDAPADGAVIELRAASAEMEDFFVRAPRIEGGSADLLAERRDSAAVTDGIGAEQIARSGDSNAAAALSRVTGLTVVGGRYVYVRGLGDRYSTTLLDGANLPSPEPEKRVVPLDLFPAGMLEQIVVQKSWTPDLPGAFGGGAVVLDTRDVPSERVFSLSMGGSYVSGTTATQGLSYEGGRTDFMGIDGGHRALPDEVAEASDSSPLEESDLFSDRGYTASELEALGEAMPQRGNIGTRFVPPDAKLSLTMGNALKIGGRPAGWLLGLSWSDQWDVGRDERSYFALGPNGLEPSHSYDFQSLGRRVQTGGIFRFGMELADGHTLGSSTLLLRSTDDETRTYEGYNRDVGGDIRATRLRFVERSLLFQQLTGEHALPLGTLDWRYSYAFALRSEPDRRETRYDNEPGTDLWLLSDRPEGNQRVFSKLDDHAHDGALAWTVRIGAIELEVGAAATAKQREVDTRRFKYMHKGPRSRLDEVLQQAPDQVFDPKNIGTDGFQFEEITRQTDNYTAGQQIVAGYTMARGDLGPVSWLAGVRVEHSSQQVSTFELFNPDGEVVGAELSTTDLLPALTGTLPVNDDMQLRAGYGRTVSRPDFRELSPATFNDVTGGRQTFGNPELSRATIDHVDLRWEWFPSPGELISASAFFKHFDDPIESIVVVSAQQSVSYANADAATNIGLELEGRKDLPKDFFIAGNTSLIRSRVALDGTTGIQTSTERPLQGQSPWVVNAQAGWDAVDQGHMLALSYNVFGPRITEVGALGAPDVYERPYHRIDAVGRFRLSDAMRLTVKGRDLTSMARVTMQGGEVTAKEWEGWSAGATLTWTP